MQSLALIRASSKHLRLLLEFPGVTEHFNILRTLKLDVQGFNWWY